MSDSLDRRDRLTEFSGPRGSMVLVTERRRGLDTFSCEVCPRTCDGGIARGVVLDEPGAGTWVLYMLPDGWSWAEHFRHRGLSAAPVRSTPPRDAVRKLR